MDSACARLRRDGWAPGSVSWRAKRFKSNCGFLHSRWSVEMTVVFGEDTPWHSREVIWATDSLKSNCGFLHSRWSVGMTLFFSGRHTSLSRGRRFVLAGICFRAVRFLRCGVLTSLGLAFINVDVIENQFMTILLVLLAGEVTTAIIRMLGKAVKFRHCPATVSAACFCWMETGDLAGAISLDHWSIAPGR